MYQGLVLSLCVSSEISSKDRICYICYIQYVICSKGYSGIHKKCKIY